jgi:hypothetical protein
MTNITPFMRSKSYVCSTAAQGLAVPESRLSPSLRRVGHSRRSFGRSLHSLATRSATA